LSGNGQSLKFHVLAPEKELFSNENPLFSKISRPLFLHGTEAAMTMERDTSPADVNLKE